jgi:hypothetical protein
MTSAASTASTASAFRKGAKKRNASETTSTARRRKITLSTATDNYRAAIVEVILRSKRWSSKSDSSSSDEEDSLCPLIPPQPDFSLEKSLGLCNVHPPANFSDIRVNTKTFIAVLNCSLNLENLYRDLKITPFTYKTEQSPKSRKECMEFRPSGDPPPPSGGNVVDLGAIISVKLENGKCIMAKGVFRKESSQTFRNSVAVDIFISKTKKLNIKISSNGNIQLTGCKSTSDCIACVRQIVWYIHRNKDIYKLDDPARCSVLEMHVASVMRNINYNIGFPIDREKLTSLIRHQKELSHTYRTLYAPQFCYAGVNIKRYFPHTTRRIKRYTISGWVDGFPEFTPTGTVPVDDFVQMQVETKGKKSSRKFLEEVRLTWLVFGSGKIILSGPNSKVLRAPYEEFNEIIRGNWDLIREGKT